MTILLIDNYDSFVYNLDRYFRELGYETLVVRNDRITTAEIRSLRPAAIVFSPGPGRPEQAGIAVPLVQELWRDVPMLGVCLGHQIIAAAFGATISRAPEPVHGRTSLIDHGGRSIFAGLPDPLQATRYHSLIVDEGSLPDELTVTAWTSGVRSHLAPGDSSGAEYRLVMALQHRSRPIFGVQFHPESVLTQAGHRLLGNFLHQAGLQDAEPGRATHHPAERIPQSEWHRSESDWTDEAPPGGLMVHW